MDENRLRCVMKKEDKVVFLNREFKIEGNCLRRKIKRIKKELVDKIDGEAGRFKKKLKLKKRLQKGQKEKFQEEASPIADYLAPTIAGSRCHGRLIGFINTRL